MGADSKIEWCHHTFNPWIGCQKVSPGCDNCYAEAMAKRYGWVTWGPHGERRRTSKENWRKPFAWNAAAYRARDRHRVFCASLADWLDNQVPQAWRIELAEIINRTPHLDWLLLTKRIENYGHLAPWIKAPSNVWLGVTCENQDNFERRWDILHTISAPVRFISYEPALGPLSIRDWWIQPEWIICGGESGPNARPMHPDWARNLRDECAASGTKFFFKQWGEWSAETVEGTEVELSTLPRNQAVAFGDGKTNHTRYTRVGKAKAGRLLDGVEHSEFPALKKAEAA